jgi:cytochrome c-type biogenesis protein CcmE
VTLARPGQAPVPPRRRWGLILGVAAVIGVIGWLAFSGIGNALVYYQTPSELLARGGEAIGQQVRLGGLVKAGSVSGPATDLTFVVTDGTTEITVHSTSAPTSSFREGIGAVVEGRLTSSGVFEASRVIVKHDENYVAPTEGQVPSHIPDGE